MKPQICRNDSHLGFLEPPHTHDLSSVSDLATLPSSLLQNISDNLRTALDDLEESTSIAFASLTRLQELFEDRFDRLMPSTDAEGDTTFSESSYFNFTNALNAERSYFLHDALPDWRHKSSLARAALHPYISTPNDADAGAIEAARAILEWWQCLQTAVSSWSSEVRATILLDYEDTIDEYFAIYGRDQACSLDLENSPIDTPDEAPTPTPGDEIGVLQLADVKMKDFAASILPLEVHNANARRSELLRGIVATRLGNMTAEEFLLQDNGKLRDERKDSGIGMAD